jgi:hypothetical protein
VCGSNFGIAIGAQPPTLMPMASIGAVGFSRSVLPVFPGQIDRETSNLSFRKLFFSTPWGNKIASENGCLFPGSGQIYQLWLGAFSVRQDFSFLGIAPGHGTTSDRDLCIPLTKSGSGEPPLKYKENDFTSSFKPSESMADAQPREKPGCRQVRLFRPVSVASFPA